jgi:amino acid adenylation domain-containing protein
MQRGMLFAALEQPEELGGYVEQVVCELNEELDIPCLEEAWRNIVLRHDALRTRFEWKDLSDAVQIVDPEPDIHLEFSDWWDIATGDARRSWAPFLESDREKGFKLSGGRLHRLTLVRFSECEYRLVWTVFHALLDGRSLAKIIGELFLCYDSLARGAKWRPDSAPSFKQYLSSFNEDRAASAKLFWKERLDGISEPTRLQLEKNEAISDSLTRYDSVTISLHKDQVNGLRQFTERENVTLHTLLQGAWAFLLSRHSGTRDVLFGITKSIREGMEISQDAAGLFINTIPFRVSMEDQLSIGDWLRELRAQWLSIRAHETVALSQIKSWSQVSAELPLLNSYLVYERSGFQESVERGGIHNSKRRFELLERTPAALTLAVYGENTLDVHLEFDTQKFRKWDMESLLCRFELVLMDLAESPNRFLNEISVLTPNDVSLMARLHDGPEIAVESKPIHELFESIVERQPDSPALEFGAKQLSYAELNKRANRVSHLLISSGAACDGMVALLLPRSIELIAGMLGVLKAGAGYIPIDPECPQERLDYLLKNSEPNVILVHPDLSHKTENFDGQVIEVSMDKLDDPDLNIENPTLSVGQEQLAYVIHTSGSTGQPKGVQIDHRALNAFVHATQILYKVRPGDRVLQFASPSFDTAVEEIFPTLLGGGTLVLRSDNMVTHASDFFAQVADLSLTVLDLPTAFWHLLVDDIESGSFPTCVRMVIIGGEAAHAEKVKNWNTVVPKDVQLFNTYGPTETTVVATYSNLNGLQDTSAGVPIGKPLPGVSVYVLDRNRRQVPPGVAGELYIGGDQVSRGYVKDPIRTGESFVTVPELSAGRLYKTGDQVYQRPDGELVYVGRFDRQVKVRGFRVELGEIESVLESSPLIKSAAVVLDEQQSIPRLAAYVTPQANGHTPGLGDIQSWAKSILPHYMTPASWTLMNEMPLTSSGKINRQALPSSEQIGVQFDVLPTRTGTEAQLAEIWSAVMGLESVGRNIPFIDLGGDSLAAVQIASRARCAFSVELSLDEFMDNGTVESMAAQIDAAPKIDDDWSVVPKTDRSRPLRLAFDQQVVWLFERLFAGTQTYHIPVVYRLEGAIDVPLLERAVNQVIVRHEALRTIFRFQDTIPVQIVKPELKIDLPVVVIDEMPNKAKSELVQQHLTTLVSQPFDVNDGPLIRGTILELDEEDHFLCMTIHHLVSDGWSIGVFVKEVVEIYSAAQEKRKARLPAIPVQYVDYAAWQRDHFEHTGAPVMNYWKETLELPLPRIYWPKDRTPPEEDPRQGALYPVELSRDLTNRIKKMAEKTGTTPFMNLLSLFKILIHQYSEINDVIIGIVLANRNRVEIEPLIGFFISTVVTRAKFQSDTDFSNLLNQVKESVAGAHAHPDMPFEKIRKVVSDEVNNTPFLQVLFLMQSMDLPPMNLPGAKATTINVDMGKSIMDLTLELYETPDGYRGWFEYCNNLFSRETMARLSALFVALAEAVTKVPDSLLTVLPHYKDVRAEKIDLPSIWEVPLEPRMLASQQPKLNEAPTDQAVLDTEHRVIEIWERVLRIKSLDRKANFFGYGGDSLLSLIMLEQVEREFGQRLEPVQMYQAPVIAQFAQLIYRNTAAIDFKALQVIQSVGVRPPLFFAGSTKLLPDLAKYLPGDQPLYSLNVFGLNAGRRDEFIFEVEEVAQAYIKEIRELQPKGPYYIAGYCQETLLALEIAGQLCEMGQRIGALILIDFVPEFEGSYSWIRRHWQNLHERGFGYIGDKLKRRAAFWARRWRNLMAGLSSRNQQIEDPNESVSVRNMGLIDLYNESLYDYEVQPYSGPVTYISASEWNLVEPPAWLRDVLDDVELREVHSCHYDLWEHPQLEYLAAAIHLTLDKAQFTDPELVPLAADDPEDNPQRKK